MVSVYATEASPPELELSAFPKPDAKRTSIAFHGLSSIPAYVPVLVEIKSRVGNTIKYVAVDAGDRAPALREHELDLTRLDDVWPRLPSTLDDWHPVDRPCALLFLSESYLKGGMTLPSGRTEREDVLDARPLVDGPCTKWPCPLNDVREIRKQVVVLEAKNKVLLDENVKLQSDFAATTAAYAALKEVHVKTAGIFDLLKQHVTALEPTLTPAQLTQFDPTLFR